MWVWSTLETPGGRTVQNEKFIGYISCLKYNFCQLLPWLKHSMIKFEISVSDFFKSWKLWRLLEGEWCILEGWLRNSMLFKMTFLTTFVSIKTLYDQIWNIFVNQSYLVFEFFESSWILAPPGGRTMHPGRLIMKINIV